MTFIQNTKIIFLLCFINITSAFSQTPGKDSLFLKRITSTYESRDVTTGRTNSSTAIAHEFKLGSNSEYIRFKKDNFKKVVDIFPESSKKYQQCNKAAKKASLCGIISICLIPTFIAGTIIGLKNIRTDHTKALVWGGVGIGSLIGIYGLKIPMHKQKQKALEYLEESVVIYNSQIKR